MRELGDRLLDMLDILTPVKLSSLGSGDEFVTPVTLRAGVLEGKSPLLVEGSRSYYVSLGKSRVYPAFHEDYLSVHDMNVLVDPAEVADEAHRDVHAVLRPAVWGGQRAA